MMNWIEGNWSDGFRCLVNHDGVFDNRMMYYSTEELWFTEWENGGPQYENPRSYEQFNPVAFVSKWQTPDAHRAQRAGLPNSLLAGHRGVYGAPASWHRRRKLLVFPDENHWVLKPANSVLWYLTVLGWLDEHLKK